MQQARGPEMASRTDFDDLDIVLRRRKGRYFSAIPQIGLYAVADSAPDALAALDGKKERLIADLRAAEALDDFTTDAALPPAQSAAPGLLLGIAGFAVKVALVAAGAAFVAVFTLNAAERAMERLAANTVMPALAQISHVGGKHFWTNVEHQLDQAADPKTAMPEPEQQRLLADLHVIVERWRPFVHEAAQLFAEPADAAPSK
jgi:hypothetical protein